MVESLKISGYLKEWILRFERNFPPYISFKDKLISLRNTKERILKNSEGVKILSPYDAINFRFKAIFIPQFEERYYSQEELYILYRVTSRSESLIYFITPKKRRVKWYFVDSKPPSFFNMISKMLEGK